jgi:hypothetical protein
MWLLVPVSCSTVQLNWVFHITLYFSVLNLMKYFCIMPLDGLLSTDVRHLKFEWVSIRVFFAFVFLSMGYVETLLEYSHNLNGKFTLGAVGMKCVFRLYLQFLIPSLKVNMYVTMKVKRSQTLLRRLSDRIFPGVI